MTRLGGVLAATALLCGCDAMQHPSGKAARPPRYVIAGTHAYPNGVGVFVLDNQAGQVCEFTFFNDGKIPVDRSCGDALNIFGTDD